MREPRHKKNPARTALRAHGLTLALSLFLVIIPARPGLAGPPTPADFATRVLAFSGTGGQPSFNVDPSVAIGAPAADATPQEPDQSSIVSFGWGGFLTLGFDQPITDDPRHPGGFDFIVFGNTLYQGGDENFPDREPGLVEVGVDPSGQHQYGDGSKVVWYWLKGTPAPATRAGFPMPLPPVDSVVVGYADCTPTDGAGDPLMPDDPYTPGLSPGSAGGDAFDLAWAVDANGAPAHLESADFVRIVCAVDMVRPVTGRVSTEVDAVALVRPRFAGDVTLDGAVTLSDAVLCARAVSGLAALTPEQLAQADATGDGGAPTLADVRAILKAAGGVG